MSTALPDPTEVRGEPCPAGFHYEWVPEPAFGWLAWRLAAKPMRCRYGAWPGGHRCENTAVARLNRGREVEQWWHYCSEHMYGRRVSGRRVWVIRTLRDEPPAVPVTQEDP